MLDPYFSRVSKSNNQAEWEYLVSQGVQDLSASWEAAADLEIDAQVAEVNISDAFDSITEYKAFLRRELEIQSTIIASQMPIKTWHEIIGDATIADAICDRIVRSSHRLDLKVVKSLREKLKEDLT